MPPAHEANAVSRFFKAGVLMSAFEDCTEVTLRIRRPSCCVSNEKRRALIRCYHPLLVAALFGNVDVIRVLLNEGNANIDFQDGGGKTALHCAIESDRPDVINLLLEQGARMGDYHEKQAVEAPFIYAAKLGNENAVELMFNKLQLQNRGNQLELPGPKKAIFDESTKRLCEVACFKACREGHFDIMDFLLFQGVDVNLSVEQRHLLYLATTKCNISIIKLLLRYGARMECERDCGIATLLSSCGSWWGIERDAGVDIVLYLLRSGCNVANGGIHACALWRLAKYSGLIGYRDYATPHQQEEIMSLLLENGYDPEKRCPHACFARKGHTSFTAKMRGTSLVEYVEKQGLLK